MCSGPGCDSTSLCPPAVPSLLVMPPPRPDPGQTGFLALPFSGLPNVRSCCKFPKAAFSKLWWKGISLTQNPSLNQNRNKEQAALGPPSVQVRVQPERGLCRSLGANSVISG